MTCCADLHGTGYNLALVVSRRLTGASALQKTCVMADEQIGSQQGACLDEATT